MKKTLLVIMITISNLTSLVVHADPVHCLQMSQDLNRSLNEYWQVHLCSGAENDSPARCFQIAPRALTTGQKVSLCMGAKDAKSRVDCYESAPAHLSSYKKLLLCSPQFMVIEEAR